MNVLELEQIEASLTNPDDPAEVNIVADVAGVGITKRLASGETLTWTADKLREFAPTMIGQPINVELDEEGDPTGHSRRVVGAVTSSVFDELTQTVKAQGSIWRHYFPSTVARLKALFPDGKVHVSMEFTPSAELQSNADGTQTPTAGRFSGLGLVRQGADPRARALLMASVREDLENQPVEVRMNLDQITEAVARKLGYRQDESDASIQTVTDDASADSEEISASQEDADQLTQEDAELATEIAEELKASLRTEFLAEVQPQLDELAALKTENTTLKAEKAAGEVAAAKEATATARIDELDKIVPAKDDAARDARRAQIAELEEPAYEALKAAYLSLAEVKGGINSDGERHAEEADDDRPSAMEAATDKIIQDMEAREAAANSSKEK